MQIANYSNKTKADLILLLKNKESLQEEKQALVYLSIFFFAWACLF